MAPEALSDGGSEAANYCGSVTMTQRPVAVIHNRYLQAGGEDTAVEAQVRLLQSSGIRVALFESSNDELASMSSVRRAGATMWNRHARDDVRKFLERERPSVAHFHNTFPLLSPSVYSAARALGIPVVQSLHNYRTICPNALLFRDGAPCEECVMRRAKWPAIVHACYRADRGASAATAGMLFAHAQRGTWKKDVNAFIALTEFSRTKFIQGGLPAARIAVSPSFLSEDPGVGEHRGGFALFVGRLSAEKGLGTLLDAWKLSGANGRSLRIVGSGPLDATLDKSISGVSWLGECTHEHVLSLMRDATFLIVPSECYESFPMTLVEAFATGLPVIASDHGAMAEIVAHEKTGIRFARADPHDLSRVIHLAFSRPAQLAAYGAAARAEFEARYTSEHALERLVAIYARAATMVAA